MHLYLHSIRKGFLKQLTDGQWEVTAMLGVSDDRVYYLSTETSPLRRDLYAVRLDGKDKKRLTGGDGTYNILPSEGFRYYISYFSNVETPERITLHAADGQLIRTLEVNATLRDTLAERGVPGQKIFHVPEFGRHRTERLSARPGDFDPAKKYPVLMTQYSGPGRSRSPTRWTMDWTDVLAQQGYIGRLRRRPGNRVPRRIVPQMHVPATGTLRNRRPDRSGPLPGGRCLTWTGRGSAFTAGVTAGSWR